MTFFIKKLLKNIYFNTLLLSIMSRASNFNAQISNYINIDIFFSSNLIFLRLIKIIIVPMIFFSILASIVNLKEKFNFSKIGKSFIIFFSTTLVSLTIGILVTFITKPGAVNNVSSLKKNMMENFSKIDSSVINKSVSNENIINLIIPENIFKSIYECNIPHIILFALLFAFAIRKSLSESKNDQIKLTISTLCDTFIKIGIMISKITPIVICSTIFWLINTIDLILLKTLNKYIFSYITTVVIVNYGFYSILIKVFTKIKPLQFHKIMFKNQLTAATLSSSAAVIPLNIHTASDKFKIKKENADLLIPLGASLNMNGDAIYLSTSFIFLAQIFNIDLSFTQYILLIYMLTIGTLGVAPIPSISIVILASILSNFSIPIYGIGIIIVIDRILDMLRTAVNITGDMVAALIIDYKKEKR